MVFKKNPKQHLLSILICASVTIPILCWPIGISGGVNPRVAVRRAYADTFPEEEQPQQPEEPEEWTPDPILAEAVPVSDEGNTDVQLTEDGLIDVSQGGVARATYVEGAAPEEETPTATRYSDVPTFTIVQRYDEADLPIELLDTSVFAPDETKYYIAADNSIIKETPDMSSMTLTSIAKGSAVTRIGVGDSWSKVRTDDEVEGYVLTNTLSIEPIPIAIARTVWVDCDSLSLRAGPDAGADYLGSLSRDTRLECSAIVDKWYKVVTPNGNEGYVYISYTTQTPPPTPTPVPTRRSSSGGGSSGGGKTGKVASLPAISGCNGSSVVKICESMLGVSYVWAGESTSGVDCSGLVVFAYRQVGVSVPHLAQSITGCGINVARSDIAVGDVVCWDTGGGYCGHVGIYVGGGQVIHASSSRGSVVYGSVDMMPILTIRRLIQ